MVTIPVMRRDHYDADNDGVVDESGASPLSDDNPQALGTASAGTGTSAARSDHVHPLPNRARGAYDAIVYIQDGDVIAEDATGDEISSGTAGTDDAAMINAAIAEISNGIIHITGAIVLESSILPSPGIILRSDAVGRSTDLNGVPAYGNYWTVNCAVGIDMGDGATNQYNFGLENINLVSGTKGSYTGIRTRRAHYTTFKNVGVFGFDRGLDIAANWSSTMWDVHGWMNNYGMYFSADALYNTSEMRVFFALPIFNYNASIYMESGAVWNSSFYGSSMENAVSRSTLGHCIYISSSNFNNKFYDMYLAADRDTTKYAFYDDGQANKLRDCYIYNGYVKTGYLGHIIDTEFRATSKITTGAVRSRITGCKFSAVSLSPSISVTQANTEISHCNFLSSNVKYYISVAANGCIIKDNVFYACNTSNNYANAYPIYISSGSGNVVSGNDLTGNANVDGLIYNGGTGIIKLNAGYVTENSGSSTGTGSEQTIAHGLVAAPSKVAIVPTETGATVSAVWADGTNIYATVTTGKAFNWSAEV